MGHNDDIANFSLYTYCALSLSFSSFIRVCFCSWIEILLRSKSLISLLVTVLTEMRARSIPMKSTWKLANPKIYLSKLLHKQSFFYEFLLQFSLKLLQIFIRNSLTPSCLCFLLTFIYLFLILCFKYKILDHMYSIHEC